MHGLAMTCDHCRCQMVPGTERTFWDGVKHCAWVCATCAAFLLSTASPGQLSPQQEPPPILRAARRVVVDSGSSSSTLGMWYWQQQLNGFSLAGQDSGDKPGASLTEPHGFSSPVLPGEERPGPEHPPHQGSTFVGISGSGAMANTSSAMRVTSWEPPDPGYSSLDRRFATQSFARRAMLRVGSVPQNRSFLPRTRRNC
jgi:hypothetical protein